MVPWETELGDTKIEVVVDAGAMPVAAPNTVPVISVSVGLDVELSVAVMHGGDPEGPDSGETACQPPLPEFAAGFHHSNTMPLFRLQSTIVSDVNVLPAERLTSRNSPVLDDSTPTGSELYSPRLTVPSPPVAVTVVPSFETVVDPASGLTAVTVGAG